MKFIYQVSVKDDANHFSFSFGEPKGLLLEVGETHK